MKMRKKAFTPQNAKKKQLKRDHELCKNQMKVKLFEEHGKCITMETKRSL